MTTTTVEPSAPRQVARSGSTPGRLIKAEFLKIWTTHTWWILALCALAGVALALLINSVQASYEIDSALNPPNFLEGYPPGQEPSQAELDRMRQDYLAQFDLAKVLVTSAANIFTSGQFIGLLLVMLLGILIVTNEFFHQTATTTFLTTPKRTEVILAKLGAAVGIAAIAWLVTTLINLAVGTLFFSSVGQPNSLSDWDVQRAILINLPAYAIWAVFGVGIGVLLRSQIASTVLGIVVYFLGTFIAQAAFFLLYQFVIKEDWVLKAMVFVPAIASQVMISAEPIAFGYSEETNSPILAPVWWVGALILIGYGLIAGIIGTLVTRKRDIS